MSDKECPPLRESASFDSLPEEIIEQILSVADPNAFASLILVNQKWRAVSQRAHLYAHHLAQCPTYAISSSQLPAAEDENLPILRRLFAKEVKRNLFDAYMRPRETVIKLVSTSISSSSCPGGDGMQFNPSPRAHHMLAYNSSRIYVLDVRKPVVEATRELKLLRRPLAVCIDDSAKVLAILSTEMQIDLYDLASYPPRLKQSIILDNSPRTIALSPCGSVLAAAYEGGIEVSSLAPGALPADRRSVRCDGVDSLAFSFDGTQILGTTTNSSSPNTVVLTAPYYDPGSQLGDDSAGRMWTTSILFPNSSRDCSHAVLIQDGSQDEASWTFAYDMSFESFRAVRVDDLRNGTTYFTGPEPKAGTQATLLPSTLPSATYHGDLVSAGFHRNELWVYGVPDNLDAVVDATSSLGRPHNINTGLSRNPSSGAEPLESHRVPQWKLLCDKRRSNFQAGVKISEVNGISNVKWISGYGQGSLQERLVATASGINGPRLVTDEEDMDFVDGGRMVLIDFDYTPRQVPHEEIVIEVGTNEAELLEEKKRDIDTEVAIVRRRTVAQRRGARSSLLRAATTSARDLEVLATSLAQTNHESEDPLLPRRIGLNPGQFFRVSDPQADSDEPSIEEQEALDAPYAHASPRSAPTLRRAATAAAVNRIVHRRTADGRPVQYRRADGRREHPHESDADNWVPPPPPYQKDDPGDLPAFMLGTAISPPDSVAPQPASESPRPANGPQYRSSHRRTASDSTTHTRSRPNDRPRPRSSPSVQIDIDDLYDVSPPGTPQTVSSHVRVVSEPENVTHILPGHLSASTAPSHVDASIYSARFSTQLTTEPLPSYLHNNASQPNLSLPNLDTQNYDQTVPPMSLSAAPAFRRFSNVPTWPGGQSSTNHPVHNRSYSLSTVDFAPRHNEESSQYPPLPTPGQISSLNKRVSMGSPRRISGGFNSSHTLDMPLVYGDPLRQIGPTEHSEPTTVAGPSRSWSTDIDQPLIISTPRGISGAFDPPNRHTSTRSTATPLIAPVARHPRGSQAPLSPQLVVERFENIYRGPSQRQNGRQASSGHRLLSRWGRQQSTSGGGTSVRVNRQPSRAERSAAINLKEARRRGWDPKKSKKKKKKNVEAASSTGWTDVTTTSATKEKKCVVM